MVPAPEQRPDRCRLCKSVHVLCLISAALTAFQIGAQTTAKPALHHRAESQTVEETDTAVIARGRTTLPLEASGEYSLGESGESVEIDLERNRLTGFVSRFGDSQSDQGTPLTFFFATSLLNEQRLSFTTHRVHGIWFSFEGTIVRGTARTRAEEGYFRLEGRLVMHDTFNNTQQLRQVSLPLARQYSSG